MFRVEKGYNDDGVLLVDDFRGDRIAVMPEQSGVLVVYSAPGRIAAVYSPGAWLAAREVRE